MLRALWNALLFVILCAVLLFFSPLILWVIVFVFATIWTLAIVMIAFISSLIHLIPW